MSEDPEGYEGAINLAWESEHPADIDAAVVADIREYLWGLSKPADLAFHHVSLTDRMEGPSVLVWGKNGSPDFHCEYHSETAWTNGDTQ